MYRKQLFQAYLTKPIVLPTTTWLSRWWVSNSLGRTPFSVAPKFVFLGSYWSWGLSELFSGKVSIFSIEFPFLIVCHYPTVFCREFRPLHKAEQSLCYSEQKIIFIHFGFISPNKAHHLRVFFLAGGWFWLDRKINDFDSPFGVCWLLLNIQNWIILHNKTTIFVVVYCRNGCGLALRRKAL